MGGYGALKPQLLATISESLCNTPVDFITLTETWGELSPGDIQGYTVSRNLQSNRETRGGGIAILHTREWHLMSAFQRDYYVLAAFEKRIRGKQADKFILAAVYIPPVNRRTAQKGYSEIIEELCSETLQM